MEDKEQIGRESTKRKKTVREKHSSQTYDDGGDGSDDYDDIGGAT